MKCFHSSFHTVFWHVFDLFIAYYYFLFLTGVKLGTAATTGLLYQPRMIDDGDCGAIGGIKLGRGSPQCHFSTINPT
jgi:hypothetical protein